MRAADVTIRALAVVAATIAWSTPAIRTPDSECAGSAVTVRATDTSTTLALDLNLPAFRLVVRENGTITHEIPVAVGRSAYPTPLGDYGIDYVVWNPPWTPPPSPWAAKEKPQKPGPDNWMGRVKMHFTGFVFLHGSPFTNSFGSAASHACVRMANENAIMLARLLHRHGSPGVSDALLDSLVADTQRTRTIGLQTIIPLKVRYDLAEVRGDTLAIYPNIYPRRGVTVRAHLLAALEAQGITLDSARIAALLKSARRTRYLVPLDSLRR